MLAILSLSAGWTLQPHINTIARGPRAIRCDRDRVRCDADRCYYGAVDADGNVIGAQRKLTERSNVSPSPTLSAEQMIDAQFEALSFADLDAAHKFVSPKVVEQYSMDVRARAAPSSNPACRLTR